MRSIVDHFRSEWATVRQALGLHALVMLLSLGIGVAVGVTLFGSAVSYYKGQAEMWESQARAKPSAPAPEKPKVAQAATDVPRPFPTAQVVGILSYAEGMPLRAGVPLRINLGVQNKGPGLARGVRFLPLLGVGQHTIEPQVAALIDREFKRMAEDLADAKPQDLPEGEKVFVTLTWDPPKEEFERVRKRELFVYANMRYEWEDASGVHQGEVCRFLNSPDFVGPAPTKEVQFAYCTSHNSIQ